MTEKDHRNRKIMAALNNTVFDDLNPDYSGDIEVKIICKDGGILRLMHTKSVDLIDKNGKITDVLKKV